MIAVLAGSEAQFRNWLRAQPLGSQTRVHLVKSEADLFGHRFDDLLVVGTFWQRPDSPLLHALTIARVG